MKAGIGAAITVIARRAARGATLRAGTANACSWFAAATPPPMAADTLGENGAADAVAASMMAERMWSEVFMDGLVVWFGVWFTGYLPAVTRTLRGTAHFLRSATARFSTFRHL